MNKNRYYKNFTLFYCKVTGEAVLKIETFVNGQVSSYTMNLCSADASKIQKILDNYDSDVKEILENGK